MKYIITKEIIFRTLSCDEVRFLVGTMINYRRDGNDNVIIWFADSTPERSGYTGPDFDIENYVEPVRELNPIIDFQPDTQKAILERFWQERHDTFEQNQEVGVVQIKRIESIASTNEFLKNIYSENVIDIKPMEKQYIPCNL